MKSKAYLSVGSNIGDRLNNIVQAVNLLRSNKRIYNVTVSSVYETEPVGNVEQQNFYNIGIKIETDLDPFLLLETLHDIEQKLHRKRLVRWGPRTIDLDIIDYENYQIKTDILTLPHKERDNRKFVLEPLLEISKDDSAYHNLLQEKIKCTKDTNWIKVVQQSEVFNESTKN